MKQPTTWRLTRSFTTNSKEVSMVASSTTSPEPTTQKPMSSQTLDRPEDLYHPVLSSKASARDPSRCRQQHPKQSKTVKMRQHRRKWHQQVHQTTSAPARRTAQLRQSSKGPCGQNRSF